MTVNVFFHYRLPMDGFDKLPAPFRLTIPERECFTDAEMMERIGNADVIVSVFGKKITEDMMDAAPRLKLIANYGVGYDNIDIAAASRRGITVTNTPDPVTDPTAELAMGLMVAVARNIVRLNSEVHSHTVAAWTVLNNLSTTLYGKTLGIVGMGAIGRSVARRAAAFGMNIQYHNRKRLDANVEQQYGAKYSSLDALLQTSDFISLHVPGSNETRGMIGASQFALMKPEAIIVNTARGMVVDENALVSALQNGRIAGAGLDVFASEPNVPEELLKMANVVVTPHVGSATHEARAQMSRMIARIITDFFDGKRDGLPVVNGK